MGDEQQAPLKTRWVQAIQRGHLQLLFLAFVLLPILLVLVLDYLNLEAFPAFNQKFLFDFTWKGRMFYLFFAWLLLLESILDWEGIVEHRRMSGWRCLLLIGPAVIPTIYIVGVNFLGFEQAILNLGTALHIRPDFLGEHWPLSVEYLVLAASFIVTAWLVYGFSGLRKFAISFALLAGIGLVYLVDTVWPFGTFKPMQLMAVPTAAFATALLDLLGYQVELLYPSLVPSQEYGLMPVITVRLDGRMAAANVGWPCAGVHSLLLFVLIILVFFKRTAIPRERKVIYFLLGAAGTYGMNILRITSFFIIAIHSGMEAGRVFHDSYGELYFMAWMFLYLMVILAIQSGQIHRVKQALWKRRGQARAEPSSPDGQINENAGA